MEKKFGFIGAGNMGAAVALTICRGAGAENVFVFDIDEEKAREFSDRNGCNRAESAPDIVKASDFIFLCVKPNMIGDVLRGLFEELDALNRAGERRVIVSIAAGVTIGSIAAVLDEAGLLLPIVRLLPNTPMAVGCGMTVMAACPGVLEGELDALSAALSAGGELMRLDEKLIDAATPVFSSSPAFTYMYIDSLADGGVMAGLPKATALRLAAQAVMGAAAMVLETGKSPGELKDAVCSPGGSTIVGVEELEKGAFRGITASAVFEAYKRTVQLGDK